MDVSLYRKVKKKNKYQFHEKFREIDFTKKLVFFSDCTACFDDILAAVTDCFSITTNPLAIIQCVQDVIGVGNDCYSCICEVITDIGNLFGQDWHC